MAMTARKGRAELHDRMLVGLRVPRIECDELWQYVGYKQKRVTRANVAVKGDQYTFIAIAASAKAILSYHTGKRDSENSLSIRTASHRFTRLTNGFSKKRENHASAVSLFVAHCNLCRVHEAAWASLSLSAP
jgi:hypothetical protein